MNAIDGAAAAARGHPPPRALGASKSLGQNFLLDLNLTGRIARAAGPLDGRHGDRGRPRPRRADARAAGRRRRAASIAIERDERAIAALAEIAAHYPGPADDRVAATRSTFDVAPYLGGGPARIVANLPYNIATALLDLAGSPPSRGRPGTTG